MTFKNYYTILGVKNTAGLDEIKAAFRNLAKKYHPDKNRENKSAEDFFKEVQEAYAVLSNDEKRRIYDRKFSYLNRYQSNAPYKGNAYQYAQQQARSQHRQDPQPPEKKTSTDPYLFIISIVIALLLLIFILLSS
ncbi:MAG TPA: DnaJ domain-containing protein [Chitinophagales bacterium]|nr:DnaJ domain-containing protein [Chitinophagales bacterium]